MVSKVLSIGFAAVIAAAGLTGFAANSSAAGSSTELSAQQNKNKGGGNKGAARSAPRAGAARPAARPAARTTTRANTTRNVKVNRTVNVKRNVTVNRNVNVRYNRGYRAWSRRPYYGSVFIGAVALGTVIAVTAPHVIPVAPGPNACWYWSDPAEINGYWDYCVPPP